MVTEPQLIWFLMLSYPYVLKWQFLIVKTVSNTKTKQQKTNLLVSMSFYVEATFSYLVQKYQIINI